MIESTILSGAIIVILGVALGFTGFLVDEQIPNQILEFFKKNPDQAFTVNEVAKAIGLPLGKAVGALSGPALGAYMTLESMVGDGAVDKKTIGRETYYRINRRSAPRLS